MSYATSLVVVPHLLLIKNIYTALIVLMSLLHVALLGMSLNAHMFNPVLTCKY